MFTFDDAKSRSNRDKHGIDFHQAQALWLDERMLVFSAHLGEPDEPRWMAIGSIDDKMWSAIFTTRDGAVRLISVRRSRKEEVALYDAEEF